MPKKTLSSKVNKYLYTDDKAKKLISVLEDEFSKSSETAIGLVKDMPFYVFKFLWPHLSDELSSKIFSELPILDALYFPKVQDNGKPVLKKIRSEKEMQEILTQLPCSELEMQSITNWLPRIDRESALIFNTQLIKSPEAAQHLLFVQEDGFGPESIRRDTFNLFLNNQIKNSDREIIYPSKTLAAPNKQKQELLRQLHNSLKSVIPDQLNSFNFNELKEPNYKFEKFLGRTALFSQKNKKELLAVKISKNASDQQDLFHEHEMMKCLNDNKESFKLESNLPRPSAIHEIDNTQLTDWLSSNNHDQSSFTQLVKPQDKYVAYTYEAAPEYFTYITEIKQDQVFEAAVLKSMHDLITMFTDYGIIFHQWVPLFHTVPDERNRPDGGKYMVLANVVQNTGSPRLLDRTGYGDMGTGRLPAFEKAVQFANLRTSGLADLADCVSIDELNKVVGTSWYHAMQSGKDRIKKAWDNKADLPLTANFLAEYIFTIGIIAGVRNKQLEKSSKEDWLNTAQTIMTAAKLAITSATNLPEAEVDKFLTTTINKERLGRQMQFFMTNEYVDYIDNNKPFPPDLYDNRTKVEIKHARVKNLPSWKVGQELAASEDGADLGTSLGAIPLTELLNLCHLVPSIILVNKQQEFNKFPVNINIQKRYEDLLGKDTKQDKNFVNVEILPTSIPEKVEPLWSKEEINKQLKFVQKNYSQVKTLLNTIPQPQLSTLLQEKTIQNALIKVINEPKTYDIGWAYSTAECFLLILQDLPINKRTMVFNAVLDTEKIPQKDLIVDYVLQQLPAEDLWTMLCNPKFESSISTEINTSPLCTLMDFYKSLPSNGQDELFKLSYVEKILNKEVKVGHEDIGALTESLQKLPENKRLEFLEYKLVKTIFDDFFQPKVNSDKYFYLKYFLEKAISKNERFDAMKIMGLGRIGKMLENSGWNKGAFLEHFVKILPEADRVEFLWSGVFDKMLTKVAKTEPHYINQIVELLPPVKKELFKIKMSVGSLAKHTNQANHVNFRNKKSVTGPSI